MLDVTGLLATLDVTGLLESIWLAPFDVVDTKTLPDAMELSGVADATVGLPDVLNIELVTLETITLDVLVADDLSDVVRASAELVDVADAFSAIATAGEAVLPVLAASVAIPLAVLEVVLPRTSFAEELPKLTSLVKLATSELGVASDVREACAELTGLLAARLARVDTCVKVLLSLVAPGATLFTVLDAILETSDPDETVVLTPAAVIDSAELVALVGVMEASIVLSEVLDTKLASVVTGVGVLLCLVVSDTTSLEVLTAVLEMPIADDVLEPASLVVVEPTEFAVLPGPADTCVELLVLRP